MVQRPPSTGALRRQPSLELGINEYVYRDPIDPTLQFLYRPHTVSVLVAILGGFLYAALYGTADHSPTFNAVRYEGAPAAPDGKEPAHGAMHLGELPWRP